MATRISDMPTSFSDMPTTISEVATSFSDLSTRPERSQSRDGHLTAAEGPYRLS